VALLEVTIGLGLVLGARGIGNFVQNLRGRRVNPQPYE
jgi:hypothetical protein